MTITLKVTPLSLWIGALLLGFGIGNMIANSLNSAKRLVSQPATVVSLILASIYTGKIVAPLILGYLLDNLDPMWFLYLCVLYSGCMLLLLIAFQVTLFCNQRGQRLVQECNERLENQMSEL